MGKKEISALNIQIALTQFEIVRTKFKFKRPKRKLSHQHLKFDGKKKHFFRPLFEI